MTKEIGIHEKIDLLGQSFDIQTEFVDPETETVRTVIFHRGAIAAHRESRLSTVSESGSRDLEVRLREHHQKALGRFVQRSLGFEARATGTEVVLDSLPVTSLGEADKAPEMPPIPEDPALSDTIEVRQLVGKLLIRLELAPGRSEDPTEKPSGWRSWVGHIGRRLGNEARESTDSTRLEKARLALSWTVVQPSYRRVRMDEQVNFRLLRERIDAWFTSDRDSQEAGQLWSDVVAFSDYLREINLRSDLVEFDRSLLDWALAAIDRGTSGKSVERPLRWIHGRDPHLDALLNLEEAIDVLTLQAEIERVRASIHDAASL